MTEAGPGSIRKPLDWRSNAEVALRDLGFAVKSLQLYPPTSPVVSGAIERSYRSFGPLLRNGLAHLEIKPGVIRVGAHDIGATTPVVEQLARRMHVLGIARMHFDRNLEAASLLAIAEIVATRPKDVDARGGTAAMFDARRPRGVLAEFLELDLLFAEPEEAREGDVWDAILRGYRSGDEDIDWDELAQSVERLADFVSWLGANLDAVAERTGYENIDIMRFVLDRLGGIALSLTSEHVDYLVLAVRQAFDQFDPDVLVELLADPLEVEVGGTGGSIARLDVEAVRARGTAAGPKTIDIGTYIAHGLEPEQAEGLILHTLRSREDSTPRLYGLFDRLTRGRPERAKMAEDIEQALREEISKGVERSEVLANWPRLIEVLNGESPQRFLSSEYETNLQQLLSPADLEGAWPIELIKPRLSEMAPPFVSLRKSLMVARLLDAEIDDAGYRRLALELERLLPRLLAESQFRTLNKLLKELLEASLNTDRPETQREIAAGVVERFYTTETVSALVQASLHLLPEESETILEIVCARGAQAIPLLLDTISVEQTRRGRQRLFRIVTGMGDAVKGFVVERLDDDRWYVLRNFAIILGEVGDSSTLEHLLPLVDHADERVRREAIAAAIHLGGPNAARLLERALDDEDPATRLMAIHGLGYQGEAGILPRLRELLRAPNFRGQNTSVVQTAAIALGRLGDEPSRSALARVSRRSFFYRAQREPARAGAAWALAEIDGTATGKAPEPAVLAELYPGAGTRRRMRG